MRKGLTTLMTVAMVVIAVQVQAMAPVIQPIPNPIVGNKGGTVSQPTAYQFNDAIDLNTMATDDVTTPGGLKWSYEIFGTPKFAVNGDLPINSSLPSDNVINPAATKQINITADSLPNASGSDPDGKKYTITIRNIALFPYGGTASSDNSSTAQSWTNPNNQQAVTFWCSDGALATSQTVLFYTDNQYSGTAPAGYSRLSMSGYAWTKQSEWLGAASWAKYDDFFDRCTSGTMGGKGVCFNVATTGQNWGSVASGMGFVTMTDNVVYKIRAKMNCNQLTPGKTPFWDFILENWNNNEPLKGLNLYGFDAFYLDNEQGANTVVNSTAGADMVMYWAPPAFQTAQWKSTVNGIYAQNALPPNGNGIDYRQQKDAQLRFRVLDVDSNAALANNNKSGSICLMSCIVETCPVTRKVYTSGPAAATPTPDIYSVAAPNMKQVHANVNDPVPGNLFTRSLTGATIAYTGGLLQITPIGTSRSADIVTITPATDTKDPEDLPMPAWADLDDDFPFPWQSNKIYELEVKLSAPDATQEQHPWDVMWLNIEPQTNEMITESYVTANKGIAMPKYASNQPQSYYMYWWSGTETKSLNPALHGLRWRIRFANSDALDWPAGTDTTNTGMVRVHSIKVNTVDFR